MTTKRIKLMLAMFGGGALLAMGALTVALEESVAQQAPAVVAQPEITTGETSTKTTAPSAPETSVAVPPFTTAPYTNTTGEVH
ncbi:hypothetical protein SAMN04489835_3950 [Mycolicibacterium rutilum]|uniref:Uncharacterized protein n=1 Tax=Mycolicibacterium rutilum TaxID=370526 RepID=A0A1H6KNI5_MYCRU|nr:hypothetical protein [Mycolicibacterium rutilum]SEH77271.1 hypothetical protein SAMN04489835_3950 [Mycolicibacterium rutilum]